MKRFRNSPESLKLHSSLLKQEAFLNLTLGFLFFN